MGKHATVAVEDAPYPFMTVREVAELLRMSTPTVYKALESGDIPGFQVLSRWRCRREQIEALGLNPVKSTDATKQERKGA